MGLKHCQSISGIWNYMENMRAVVMDLSTRVSKAQDNVMTIKDLVQQWKGIPLVERSAESGLLNLKGQFEKESTKMIRLAIIYVRTTV